MNNRRSRICMTSAVFALFAGISPFEVPAEERNSEESLVAISGVETFIAESVGDNGGTGETVYGDDDNFVRLRNRFYLDTRARGFDSALRFDATLFHLPPERVAKEAFVPGGEGYTTLNYDNDFRLEHLHGSMTVGHLKLTLGDFYVNFGRGAALSLIKIDDLDEDNQLRGVRLDYKIPRRLSLTLVGGVVNAVNLDPITRQVFEDDPLDRIVGVRSAWELLDVFNLGVHGVIVKPRYTDWEQIPLSRRFVDRSPGIQIMTGGGFLEAHLEGIHAYFEGNAQAHENFRVIDASPKEETGTALFGEVSYDLPPFGLKAEGIYYRKWLMEGPYRGVGDTAYGLDPLVYNHMVTLEPAFVPIKSMGNVFGGRLGGNVYLDSAETDVSLKVSALRYEGGLLPNGVWQDHPETTAVHTIVELNKTFRDPAVRMHVEGGGRFETTRRPEIEGVDSGYLWHLKSDVTVPIKGVHSIEMAAEVRRHALDITEGNRYYVTLSSLGYRMAGIFDVTFAHEYSNEVVGGQRRLGNMKWLAPPNFAWAMGTLYLSGFLEGLSLRGVIGSQRGGIKCAGGICRQYPDTVGAKLEINLKF